eukprot:1158501-Pelagomonas_calceolata.AAC.1
MLMTVKKEVLLNVSPAHRKMLDGHTQAVGSSCECTALALLHTQRLDQLHQVRATSETRHPGHKARDNKKSAKTQWKVEQKVE